MEQSPSGTSAAKRLNRQSARAPCQRFPSGGSGVGKATDDRKGSRSGQRLPGKTRIGNVPEESLRLRARLENSDTPPEAARGRSPSCLSYEYRIESSQSFRLCEGRPVF